MKLNENSVYSAINDYIETELMPMTSGMGSLEQFTFGITLGIFKRKVDTVVKKLIQNKAVQFLGIVDDDGMIDVETAYLAASDVLKNGRSVEVAGIRFTNRDLDKLYENMCRYA